MSSGGQSNASQTPFAPNYGQAQGISGLGAGLTGGGFGSNMGGGNAYAQKFKQPSMGMFPPTSPQPNQPPPGMELNPDYVDRFANGQAGTLEVRPSDNRFRPIQARTGTDKPPPGMMLNPEYSGDLPSGTLRSFGFDSIKYVPDPNQPQPQTGGDLQYRDAQFRPGGGDIQRDARFRPGGGDIQYAGGTPGFYNQGGQGYGNPFGGGFGGGYGGFDGGYGGFNPMMGMGLGGFGGYGGGFGGYGGGFGGYGGGFGGYGGFNPMMGMGLGGMMGGFQGGFNPQSQAQAQMRAYQQNQQSQMIPLDQPDSNSYSLTRSYMDPVSGRVSTVY